MVYEYFHRDFQQAQTQNDTWQLTRQILYHLGIQEKIINGPKGQEERC